ncbi:MAG: ribbon-helix-helix domain-containing protein [Acidimicrobiales bacterium]
MNQVVVTARIPDELIAAVDQLVSAGEIGSRSDAIRVGLETLLRDHRRGAARAEAERLRASPADLDEVRRVQHELERLRAW